MIDGGREHQIVAAPSHLSDGVANMLVALGDAGIGVSRVELQRDDEGLFRLTVEESPELALRILEGIGCQVPSPVEALAY